jgi:hypothetical protein
MSNAQLILLLLLLLVIIAVIRRLSRWSFLRKAKQLMLSSGPRIRIGQPVMSTGEVAFIWEIPDELSVWYVFSRDSSGRRDPNDKEYIDVRTNPLAEGSVIVRLDSDDKKSTYTPAFPSNVMFARDDVEKKLPRAARRHLIKLRDIARSKAPTVAS